MNSWFRLYTLFPADNGDNIMWTRLTLTACVFWPCVVSAQQGRDQLLDQIEAAWKERQDKVKSAVFELRVESIYPKGSISDQAPSRFPGRTVPESEKTVAYTAKMTMDENRFRLEEDGVRWNGTDFGAYRTIVLMTEKGKRRLEERSGQPAEAYALQDNDYFELNLQAFATIARCFRGTGPMQLRLRDLDDFQPNGLAATIRGVSCQPFRVKLSDSSEKDYWLDPARGWVIIRTNSKTKAPKIRRTDLDVIYEVHPICGVVPQQWQETTYIDGRLGITRKCKMTRVEITSNATVSDGELQFPVGTHVADERWHQGTLAVIQPDGTYAPHPANHPERIAEIRRQEQAETTRWWGGWIGGGLVLIGVSSLLWRWRRKRHRQLGIPETSPISQTAGGS